MALVSYLLQHWLKDCLGCSIRKTKYGKPLLLVIHTYSALIPEGSVLIEYSLQRFSPGRHGCSRHFHRIVYRVAFSSAIVSSESM